MPLRLVALTIAIFIGFAIAAPFGNPMGISVGASSGPQGAGPGDAMPASHHGATVGIDQNAQPHSHGCRQGGEAQQCRCSLFCVAAGLIDAFHVRIRVNPVYFLPQAVANLHAAGTVPADPPPRA